MTGNPSMRVLANARIYTLDPHRPHAAEIVLKDGLIHQVGTQQASARSSAAEIIDLEGRVILPGLIDAHIHLRKYAQNLAKVNCETPAKDLCLDKIRQRTQTVPPGNWILGHGWNHNLWSGGYGSAWDLDRITPDHPVYLTAKSLHAAWANSKALEQAGIHSSTPDPPGGKISRDAQGNPDGILFENAMQLIEDLLPRPSLDETVENIHQAQADLWKLGITGVHDYDRQLCFSALQQLKAQNRLKLRVLKQIQYDQLSKAVELGLRSGFGDPFLRIGGVKIFTDGALGPQTAAMLEPYQNQPQNYGMLLWTQQELDQAVVKAITNGFPLTIHAIGDRANRVALNSLEKARGTEKQLGLPAYRHRIEHVQLLHPDDLHRLGKLAVIASMQPLHAPSDRTMAAQHWGKRSRYAYAWKSQVKNQAPLAFGSDAPVESPNPFQGLHAAVTRRCKDGKPGSRGWIPEERLTIQEAIGAYTQGAAYAAGWEHQAGKLASGYWGDLIVLDKDPFTLDPDQLYALLPSATMVAGEFVWKSF